MGGSACGTRRTDAGLEALPDLRREHRHDAREDRPPGRRFEERAQRQRHPSVPSSDSTSAWRSWVTCSICAQVMRLIRRQGPNAITSTSSTW